MKWYWPVSCDNTEEKSFVAGIDNLEKEGYEDWELNSGQPIKEWKNTVWLKADCPEDDGDPDDVL